MDFSLFESSMEEEILQHVPTVWEDEDHLLLPPPSLQEIDRNFSTWRLPSLPPIEEDADSILSFFNFPQTEVIDGLISSYYPTLEDSPIPAAADVETAKIPSTDRFRSLSPEYAGESSTFEVSADNVVDHTAYPVEYQTDNYNTVTSATDMMGSHPSEIAVEQRNTNQFVDISNQRYRARNMKFEDLAQHFHEPVTVAADKLQLGPTTLKKICRRLNIKRWPYRKVVAKKKVT